MAGALAFRTLRDVRAGEELVVNYAPVDVLETRAQRRADLLQARGFVCVCDACAVDSEEGEASDKRRTAVSRLFEDVAQCGKEPTLGMRKVCWLLRSGCGCIMKSLTLLGTD